MIKLYKRDEAGKLRYHEAWAAGRKIVEHWGVVGERGETKEHKVASGRKATAIEKVLAPARAEGFVEEQGGLTTLIIEYPVESAGSAADLLRRERLEDRMNELLGWTGVGHCDGGSIGSGTMEVCCLVVDFEIARKVIEDDLRGSAFADYSRIYDEGAAQA